MHRLPPPVSVEEALHHAPIDVDVPPGASIAIGPFVEEYSHAFRVAEITSFTDLHRLGFIRREISEAEIVGAIRADDRMFAESRRHHSPQPQSRSCSCAEEATAVSRRHFQDHLVALLQPLYRDLVRYDDPAVIHPYHHGRAWLSRPSQYLIGIAVLNDINIEDDATLTMTPSVQGLYANAINMGENARLRFQSGGVHVRCNTLNGPNPFQAGVNFYKYVKGLSLEGRG